MASARRALNLLFNAFLGVNIEYLPHTVDSRLQIHPPQQVLEARVVMEGIKCRVYLNPIGESISVVKSFGQPFCRLVLLSEDRITECSPVR